MTPIDVTVTCWVQCEPNTRYRVWVDQELFAERQWRWTDHTCLEEVVPVRAAPGQYHIRVEPVVSTDQIRVWNWRVEQGAAQVSDQGLLEISHALA